MEHSNNKETCEVSEDLNVGGTRLARREKRFSSGAFVRNAIIGFADGLTVPFALTAGLSAFGSSQLVISGGLAELFAGAISMGLGAYLATATERKSYDNKARRESDDFIEFPERKREEICELLGKYGVSRRTSELVAEELKGGLDAQVQFMMDNVIRMEKTSSTMALLEGFVMGVSYLLGGFLPMVPYFALQNVFDALYVSIGVTAFVLLGFGYVKAIVTGTTQKGAAWSAVQTFLIGAAAAASSYGIVRALNAHQSH